MSEHICTVCFMSSVRHDSRNEITGEYCLPPLCCYGCHCGQTQPPPCPACISASPSRDGLWWSKAGRTSSLCQEHLGQARDRRRVQRELATVRRLLGRNARVLVDGEQTA